MTKPKKKDSLDWLEELVESAKKWRASLMLEERGMVDSVDTTHNRNERALATAVDGYRQAIEDEVKAELDDAERFQTVHTTDERTGRRIHRIVEKGSK
jgi:hypothetical protein